eukprot:GHVH01000035.1.p1 GENE.GHVH01000035.1~~GHVH01000035.1.p1  ORF type:complete len:194 (+),score=38.45 GHVH01000035.1:21-602(+)
MAKRGGVSNRKGKRSRRRDPLAELDEDLKIFKLQATRTLQKKYNRIAEIGEIPALNPLYVAKVKVTRKLVKRGRVESIEEDDELSQDTNQQAVESEESESQEMRKEVADPGPRLRLPKLDTDHEGPRTISNTIRAAVGLHRYKKGPKSIRAKHKLKYQKAEGKRIKVAKRESTPSGLGGDWKIMKTVKSRKLA